MLKKLFRPELSAAPIRSKPGALAVAMFAASRRAASAQQQAASVGDDESDAEEMALNSPVAATRKSE